MGLTYTITPGLSISITNNDFSGKGGTAVTSPVHVLLLHSTLLSNLKEMLYWRRAGFPALLFLENRRAIPSHTPAGACRRMLKHLARNSC